MPCSDRCACVVPVTYAYTKFHRHPESNRNSNGFTYIYGNPYLLADCDSDFDADAM